MIGKQGQEVTVWREVFYVIDAKKTFVYFFYSCHIFFVLTFFIFPTFFFINKKTLHKRIAINDFQQKHVKTIARNTSSLVLTYTAADKALAPDLQIKS